MFSSKFNLIKLFTRRVTKNQLQSLNYVDKGQPFCNIVSKNQNTYKLDTVYLGQPFVGTPNNFSR